MTRDEMKAEIAAIDLQLPDRWSIAEPDRVKSLRVRRRWLCEQLAGWYWGKGNSGKRPEIC